MLRCLKINIIEINRSADVINADQIAHKPPGPSAGTAADIRNFYFRHLTFFKNHKIAPFYATHIRSLHI